MLPQLKHGFNGMLTMSDGTKHAIKDWKMYEPAAKLSRLDEFLDLAGQVFENNVNVLARHNQMGPWRFAEVRRIFRGRR